MSDDSAEYFEDIPTKDIKVPTNDEIPMMVFAHTHAIRGLVRRFAKAETWFRRMTAAFLGSGIAVSSSLLGAAYLQGEREARAVHTEAAVEDVEERVTYLERKNDGRARRGRESEE